ncbi:MAG: fluoride efflux transporter CrcB [Planctomycetota bacterium]
MDLLWLAAGGALGTLCRYGVYRSLPIFVATGLPHATILVNLAGSFVFGLIAVLASESDWIPTRVRWVLLTGFLGAFTTFSTFAYETVELLRAGRLGLALVNGLVQTFGAVGGAALGMAIGRAWTTSR